MTATKINTNAFAGTFAFLPTLEPIQKKQKSQQAIAQGQCKLWTTYLRPKRTTTDNSGFKKLAVTCLIQHLCFVSSVVLADSLVLRNRQLLKPAKRQDVKKPTIPFFQLQKWVYNFNRCVYVRFKEGVF